MLDNYSLVAMWEGNSHDSIEHFAFRNNKNDELVVVFKDTTIALMRLEIETNDEFEQDWPALKQFGCLEITKKYKIFNSSEDIQYSIFHSYTHGSETWVGVTHVGIEGVFTLCSVTDDELRKVKIKTNINEAYTTTFCSISQKALILVMATNRRRMDLLQSRIWSKIDFDKDEIDDDPTEIKVKSFGISECGKYFLNWKTDDDDDGANKIKLYKLENSQETGQLVAEKPFGQDVTIIVGQFLKRNKDVVKALKCKEGCQYPLISYLITYANVTKLEVWDPFNNTILKEMNVSTNETDLPQEVCNGYCISSDMKWVGVGYENRGIVGLFCFSNGVMIWKTKVTWSPRVLDSSSFLHFDDSSTRLLAVGRNELYVFCPPCLREDYQLEFRNVSYELTQNCAQMEVPLQSEHQMLIPKQVLKQMLISQHQWEVTNDVAVQDIANSTITSTTTVLFLICDRLRVVQGPFKEFFSSGFKEYVEHDLTSRELASQEGPNGLKDFHLGNSFIPVKEHSSQEYSAWIFLYQNENKDQDLTAVFSNQQGLVVDFINFSNGEYHSYCFTNKAFFVLKQSKDGSNVFCLCTSGVIVFDLRRKEIKHDVSYKVNLSQLLDNRNLERCQSFLGVTNDGEAILIGWDMNNENLLTLTSRMNKEEWETIFIEDLNIVPCWFSEDMKRVSFLEFNKGNQLVSSICIYCVETEKVKRIEKEQWSLQTKRSLSVLNVQNEQMCALHFAKEDGHLWITALLRRSNTSHLIITPINPYSLSDCIPSLHMQDYQKQNIVELKELAAKYGHALATMVFNSKTNFQIAVETNDKCMMNNLFNLANEYGAASCWVLKQGFGVKDSTELLKHIVQTKNEFGVLYLLDLIDEKRLSFEDSASILKGGFEELLLNFRTLLEPKIIQNSIARKLCDIDVPSNVLTIKTNTIVQIGTCECIPTQWNEHTTKEVATSHWKGLHKKELEEIESHGSGATTTAALEIFLIANVCKIGLNGIIRFLLMQEAPSHLFKTPLLKWVITYKWLKIWKNRSIWKFGTYLVFIIVYTSYSIWIAFVGNELNHHIFSLASTTFLLFISIIFAIIFLYQEWIQMRTYIDDGNHLFQKRRYWGLHKYWTSAWNVLEVISYVILIIVIPFFHIANLCGLGVKPCFYALLAIETSLIWIKVWYYAQALDKTGAFVLMIENVIKDCLAFLVLTIVILIGSSLTLFILFQFPLQINKTYEANSKHEDIKGTFEDENKEDEVRTIMEQSFGDPWKAVITLFYAMIGTFEPTVYYDSGTLSYIITIAFVLYLAAQMIVMLNMLIAIMGDTFDRVKDTEEEQLLLGRARFIDACEAQLKQAAIDKIENGIEKYLYVVSPEDANQTEEMKDWQGKVKAIEKSIAQKISESETKIMNFLREDRNEITQIRQEVKKIMQMEDNIRKIEENIKTILQKLDSMNARGEGQVLAQIEQ
eukprot:g7433.t1